MWNVFKVDIEDTKTIPLTPFFSVSIVILSMY